jgi:hypothetical protein
MNPPRGKQNTAADIGYPNSPNFAIAAGGCNVELVCRKEGTAVNWMAAIAKTIPKNQIIFL